MLFAKATTDVETRNTRIDELTRTNDELRLQIATQGRVIEQQKAHINTKCVDMA